MVAARRPGVHRQRRLDEDDDPWREYATVVLLAFAVLVLRPRPLRLLASFALVVAAFAVLFGVV